MWSFRALSRIDFRVIPIILALMAISLLVISSYSIELGTDFSEEGFFTPQVKRQLEGFLLGAVVFVLVAGFDYHKLREWTWFFYIFMLLTLIGLFFTDSIQRVNRWYKLPLIGINFQPSEYAKLVVVLTLSWFLERRRSSCSSLSTALLGGVIVGIPFLLILKQPDLGTALVLFPITLVMFYFGDIHRTILKAMSLLGIAVLILVGLIFSGILSHEEIRPYATHVLKDYQFDRLDPNTYHQKASVIAIAIGGLTGSGWKKSSFGGNGYLPAPYTDSVFPAFGEEFGFIGLMFLLALYYALLYFSFQVTATAKDEFGRLLSAGIAVYLAMHILVNIGMMCGLLPITGVPLVLVTYGGSSSLATMAALGLLQSVYSRRFMF
ncbi:MAG: FtsW/RodA/SpoVE family cell cycle protein [Parachlamydiaceae bacterium]